MRICEDDWISYLYGIALASLLVHSKLSYLGTHNYDLVAEIVTLSRSTRAGLVSVELTQRNWDLLG